MKLLTIFGNSQGKTMSKKIIIVEDEAIIAIEIESTLSLLGYQVVGKAMNGDKALDLFANTECDLIMLDISIKGSLTGIDLAKVIRKKYQLPFIFLTSFSDRSTLDLVKETNPYGYIVKPFNEKDLLSTIELAVYKFESERSSIDRSKSYVESQYNIELTEREYDIAIAFCEGLTYKEIAAKLFISVNTVKSYQKRIFQMLEVSSRHDLVVKLST